MNRRGSERTPSRESDVEPRNKVMTRLDFDPPLDVGIEPMVLALRAEGVETFESCEGGPGHAYPEPTVRFHGEPPEGYRALAVALQAGLNVTSLRRIWIVQGKEASGPYWELTFCLTYQDAYLLVGRATMVVRGTPVEANS